jgi:phage baseplate assembly protein W
MKFPFEIKAEGAVVSDRREHVREVIEQVLHTIYGERWYRPEFGVGIRTLVFEPNNDALAQLTKKRVLASLTDALAGEVDPKTLTVDVTSEEEKLAVTVSYTVAAINHTERQKILYGGPYG